jgi:hypothetical protein
MLWALRVDVARLVRFSAPIALVVTLLVTLAFPQYAQNWGGRFATRFVDPNSLGAFSAMLCALCLFGLRRRPDDDHIDRAAFWLALVGLGSGLWLILGAGSRGGGRGGFCCAEGSGHGLRGALKRAGSCLLCTLGWLGADAAHTRRQGPVTADMPAALQGAHAGSAPRQGAAAGRRSGAAPRFWAAKSRAAERASKSGARRLTAAQGVRTCCLRGRALFGRGRARAARRRRGSRADD